MLYYIKKRTDSLLRLTAIKTKIGGLIMKNEIKKTVVPQFVAEWFEENKWDLEYEIYNVITEIFSKDSSEYSKNQFIHEINVAHSNYKHNQRNIYKEEE